MAEENVTFIYDSYNKNKNVFGLSLKHDRLEESNMMRYRSDTSRLETCYPLESARVEMTRFEGKILVWDMNSVVYKAVSKFQVDPNEGEIKTLMVYVKPCGSLENETLFKVLPFKFTLFNETNVQVERMVQAATNPQEGTQNQ